MEGVTDYGEGISAVDSLLVRPRQTAVHIVVEGGRAAVVDVPSGACVPRVLAALAERGVAPEQVDYVVLTHVHLDHAGGAGSLMARCPNARLAVHPRGARHMIDPGRLMQATVAIYGEAAAQRMYGDLLPVPAGRVIETPDGATLRLAGRELLLLDAPGHARHHVVVRDARTGHFFAGDAFGLSYRELDRDGRQFSFPTTTPSQFDPPALHASLARLLGYAPEAVYVAHFGQLRDIPRLADDLRRLLDAHVALARQLRAAGPGRLAQLMHGVRDIVVSEGKRQGWRPPEADWVELFGLDIALNAQGLEAWLAGGGTSAGAAPPAKRASFPSEKR